MGSPFVFSVGSPSNLPDAPVSAPMIGLSWVLPGGAGLGLGALTAFPEGLDPKSQ